MLRVVRFLPLVMIVLFVAWCSKSNERRREVTSHRVELVELFMQHGLAGTAPPRAGDLDALARRAGTPGMNQLLYAAAHSASLPALRWIVDHGADPASVGAPGGVPLLHKAATVPTSSRLGFFLELGLNARERDSAGNTVLHVVARGGLDEPMLQLLLGKGLKLTDSNAAGQLPIHVASLRSMDMLVRAGADIDAPDGLGRTALHLAAADRRADRVSELLRLGASVFKADRKGRTPLHLAALARDEPSVDLLLAAGAPRSARDADGLTARELSTQDFRSSARVRDLSEKL